MKSKPRSSSGSGCCVPGSKTARLEIGCGGFSLMLELVAVYEELVALNK